nr:pyrimidine 5'-nucleotidase [Cupriavidus sp. AU9028]
MLRRPAGNQAGPVVWLFDLDNTLHDASYAIFPAINAQMTAYVARVLGCDEATASRVRVDYWQRYGATLLGMIRHHGVDPAEFLHAAHDFPELASMVRVQRGLARMLRRLPGRKVLLTNAPQEYARAVLRVAGIERMFERVVAIEQMWVHGELRPKPDRRMLRHWLARIGVDPSRAVLVEDTVSHLKRYQGLGIRTAWITGYLRTLTPSRPHAAPAGETRDAATQAVLDAERERHRHAAGEAAHAAQEHAVALVAAETQAPQPRRLKRANPAHRPRYVHIKVQSSNQLHRRMRGIGS